MSRELLSWAWAAGQDPATHHCPSICDAYGLDKVDSHRHNYSGQGVLPACGSRIRRGRANTARDAVHFLPETMSRVRDAGARRQPTMHADSGFYAHDIVAAFQKTNVRFSMTVCRHRSLCNYTRS